MTGETASGRRIVTGERGAGKTTFCRALVERARKAGWDTAGLLSLPRYEARVKTGILIEDLRGRTSRLLASRNPDEVQGFRFCGWTFSQAAFDRANEVLLDAVPCDLLVVDEAGPLEFDRGIGFTSCFAALGSGAYRLAVAVARPSYCGRLEEIWPAGATVSISSPEEAVRLAEAWFREQADRGARSGRQ